MKKIIILLNILLILLISNFIYGQSGWTLQPISYAGLLSDVKFFDANTGCMIAASTPSFNYVFLKTSDGGLTWTPSSNGMTYSLYSMNFLNKDTGFVADIYSHLYRTLNAGTNWVNIGFGVSLQHRFQSISFLNANTGCVIDAAYLKVFKTTNGGTNWDSTFLSPQNNRYWAVKILNLDTLIICGDLGTSTGIVYTTFNSGSNWDIQSFPASGTLNHISFADKQNGVISGAGTSVLKTTNAGLNWVQLNCIYSNSLSSACIDANRIYLICGLQGNGSVVYTTNGGTNWMQTMGFGNNSLAGIFFLNNNTGWISGGYQYTSALWKTTNGGLSFVNKISSEVPKEYRLFQNYPNPFNPSTKIKFSIPFLPLTKGAGGMDNDVRLTLFDITGKQVAELLNEPLSPGSYEIAFNAINLSSGIYFYKLRASDFEQTKRMILLK